MKQIQVPSGFTVIEHDDGSVEVVRTGVKLCQTVAFRVTAQERAAMQPFIDSFPDGSTSEALRWLICHPAVVALMERRSVDGAGGP